MCDDASAETSGSSEVSDVSDDGSCVDSTENGELYDSPQSSVVENADDYSNEVTDNQESELEDELVDSPSSTEEENVSEDSKEVSASDEKSEISESSDINQNSNPVENTDLDSERTEIEEKSEYSNEINDRISSKEELEVYQKAGLKEENIDGRTCLIRGDIDMDYIDPKSGMTNRELMEKGRAPYDSKTGERIELHHIGQEYNSPLAELTADTEHGQFYTTLHAKDTESWRSDEQKSNRYNNVERPQHWKSRAKESKK